MEAIAHAVLRDRDSVPGREASNTLMPDLRTMIECLNDPLKSTTIIGEDVYRYNLTNVRFQWPTISPEDAISLGRDYSFTIYMDAYLYKNDVQHSTEMDLAICVPCALFSNMCRRQLYPIYHPLDAELQTAYITYGRYRYFPLRERVEHNRLHTVTFMGTNKILNKGVEMRVEHSDAHKKFRSTSTLCVFITGAREDRISMGHQLMITWSFLNAKIPLVVVMLAHGWSRARSLEQFRANGMDERMKKYMLRFEFSNLNINTKEDAETYLTKFYPNKRTGEPATTETIQNTLHLEILPNMNDQPLDAKMEYLIYISCQAIRFDMGLEKDPFDMNATVSKEVQDASCHLATHARAVLRVNRESFVGSAINTLKRHVKRKATVTPDRMFNGSRITRLMSKAVGTGVFTDKKFGITHPVFTRDDDNIPHVQATLCKVFSSLSNSTGEHFVPRMMRPDSYGIHCSATTPEGTKCGMVQELAIYAGVTLASDPMPTILYFIDLKPVTARQYENCERLISPTGQWLGWVEKGVVTQLVRRLRRCLAIAPDVGVATREGEVHVYACAGRYYRLLAVRENLHKFETLEDHSLNSLFHAGIVECISPVEEREITVSLDPHEDATHVEISHNSILGRQTSTLAFAANNQAPRLSYQVSMRRQSAYTTIPKQVGTSASLHLVYGQTSLMVTRSAIDTKLDKLASTVNIVAAVGGHASAQEDGAVISQHLVDMLGGCCINGRNYSWNCDPSKDDMYCVPNFETCAGLKSSNYSKLCSNGVPKVGTRIYANDVVIGMQAPNDRGSEHEFKDTSIMAKRDEIGGVVIKVTVKPGIRHVIVATLKNLEVGDKMDTIHHGQKCTVTAILPSEDMPFGADGQRVDAIFSPHSFPSRMTCGWLYDLLGSTATAVGGERIIDDQIMISGQRPNMFQKAQDVLKANGCTPLCTSVLYNGMTGEMMGRDESTGVVHPFTVGLMPMCVLYHKSSNKNHCREEGPMNALRQPTDGRRNDGGLRIGSMENDCLTSHGAMNIMQSLMRDGSDPYDVSMCKRCQRICEVNDDLVGPDGTVQSYENCVVCNKSDEIRDVRITYAAHTFFLEMQAANFSAGFMLRDLDEVFEPEAKRRKVEND